MIRLEKNKKSPADSQRVWKFKPDWLCAISQSEFCWVCNLRNSKAHTVAYAPQAPALTHNFQLNTRDWKLEKMHIQ